MKREYEKPDMCVVAVTTAYGVMQDGSLKDGGGTGEGNIKEAYSKHHDFAIDWEGDESDED